MVLGGVRHTVGLVDDPHDEPGLHEPARLFAALRHGAPDLPPEVAPRDVVIAAAGVWGRYGSVVVLRRDWEEDNALLDDVYLLARTPAGQWLAPGSSSGSVMPEWVLARPDEPLPEWSGSDLVNLGAELAYVDGRWLAGLTVMASRPVTTVEVRYGTDEISVPVPPSGLVTLPGAFVGVLIGSGNPVQAGAAQVLVLIGLLAAEAVAAVVTTELVARGRISRLQDQVRPQ
jgi:hypothetical protein